MTMAGARLGVMTADEFKNRTKATKAICGFASKFKTRGSSMSGIDRALEAWDQKCNSNLETAQKLAHLVAIAYECEKWIKKKAQKSSRLCNFRKQVVEQLYKSLKNPVSFLRNKIKNESGSVYLPTKALSGNYKYERTNYLERGKTENPYSASSVAGDHHATFDNMSYEQFVSAAGETNDRVYFMNRSERMEHLLTIDNGLLYRQGEPYDCALDVRQARGAFDRRIVAETYAADKYGNIFSKPINGFNGTFFNHSSYCAGKEILCAGTLATKDGKLLYVSNLSGHYKPTPAHLAWLLVLLAEEDIDLDDVCVTAADGAGIRHCKAASLIRNAKAPTDWPNMAGNDPQVVIAGDNHAISNPQ